MKSKIWLGIEILAGIILIILIGFFVKRKIEDQNYLKQQSELKESISSVNLVVEKDDTKDEEDSEEALKKMRDKSAKEEVSKLKEKHPSIIAIIEIPGTDILYPIVQGKDNLFYLDHDKDGNYHPFGEVYLDARNDSRFIDKNSVVYGHNIRSAKTLFNGLLNYSEQEFFNEHRKINIYTLEGYKEYDIISVYKAKPEEPYREMKFSSDENFEEFVKKYHEKSLVETGYENPKNIITLSTCFDNSYRFVIQGVEVVE